MALVPLVTLAPFAATAQTAVQQIVPYTGHLDHDGAPLDGLVAFRFRLYADPAAAAAPADDPCDGSAAPACVWKEEHRSVNVHAGAFTVRLGRPDGPGAVARDIAPFLKRNVQHALEVAVLEPASQAWIVLGRQNIHPVPQALFTVQEDVVAHTVHVANGANTDATGPAGMFPFRVGDASPGSWNVGIDSNEIAAMVTTAGDLVPSRLYLNARGGGVELGNSSLNTSGEVAGARFRATGPQPRLQGVFVVEPQVQREIDRWHGLQTWELAPYENRVCWLAGMAVNDGGDNGDLPLCHVYPDPGSNRWFLNTRTQNNVQITCITQCMSW